MVHSSPDSRKHREAGSVAQLLEPFLGVCKAPGLIPSWTDTGSGDTSVTPVRGGGRGGADKKEVPRLTWWKEGMCFFKLSCDLYTSTMANADTHTQYTINQ